MNFLIISGVIALIFGVLLLVAPKSLRKINMQANKLISDIDNIIYKYRQGVGICLLLSAAMLLFVAYYLYKT